MATPGGAAGYVDIVVRLIAAAFGGPAGEGGGAVPLERAPASPRLPWDERDRRRYGVLRLAPDAFWAMTPREFALAVRSALGRERRPSGAPTSTGFSAPTPDQQRRRMAGSSDELTVIDERLKA